MDLSKLNVSELSEREQMMLAPFYVCYRPHTAIPPRKVLKVEGEGSYFKKEKTLDLVKYQASMMDKMYYTFLESVTRDEFGNIIDSPLDG